MEPLEIKIYGDKVLRNKAGAVADFGEELDAFVSRMESIMIAEQGIGLAAPQVGMSERVILFYIDPQGSSKVNAMINPEIIGSSDELGKLEEGCLSIPDIRGEVQRPLEVEVKYQSVDGTEHTDRFHDLTARIIQHEIDHINGILFVDHFSFAKKAMVRGKLRKLVRNNSENG
jgi:peptide deformylase